MLYKYRIVCTTAIRWLNTSLQVLHIGGGGAIFHIVWKVLSVPSGGAGLLSIWRLGVVLVLFQQSLLPPFVLYQVARRTCVELQVVVWMYYWVLCMFRRFEVYLHWFYVASCYRTAR
jgi:hypothetical protein